MKKIILAAATLALASAALVACKKKDDSMGPAQKMGQQVDQQLPRDRTSG